MRTTGKATMLAAAVLSVGLTGCTDSGTTPGAGASGGASGAPGGTATATATATGGTETGSAASCLVGNWTATGLAGKASGSGVEGEVTGGAGLALTISPDGKTQVNFDPMKPVNFSIKIPAGDAKGSFSYSGRVSGVIKTPTGNTGTFEPVGTTDFGSVTVTVDVSSPLAARVADKVPLKDFTGTGNANAGAAVDAQPILRRSQYECAGNTLKLTPPAGTPVGGTWTLTKS